MTDVVFRKLVIRDFKAFRGTHEFYLDREAGLYFVRGKNKVEPALSPNGSAKSTLWDAICWCLYGETVQGLKNPDVIPWKSKGLTPRVGLAITVSGKTHALQRSTSPNRLTLDGKDVSPEAVVKLIRMPFVVFTNTVILGQGQDLFLDRSPSEKLKLLSDVKNLDAWDERSKHASGKVRDIEDRLSELAGFLDATTALVASTKSNIKKLTPKADAWREENAEKLAVGAAWVKANRAKLDKMQRRVDGYTLKYDGAMTEVKACERAVNKFIEELSNVRHALFTLNARQDQLDEKIKTLQKEYDDCKPGKSCPTCGQRLKQDGGISHHRADLKRAILHAEKDVKELRAERPWANKKINQLKEQLEWEQVALKDFHAKADAAIQAQGGLQEELAGMKARMSSIRRDKEQADLQPNPYTEQLRALRSQQKLLEKDLIVAEEDQVFYKRRLEQTRFWVKGFKDVKLHIIEELLEELELTAASLLEEVGLIGWEIRYSIERETKKGTVSRGLTVLIGSPSSSGLVKWESWSGGEQQRLRLVGSLALSEVLLNHAGIQVNLEVLDEPTQHLSDGGIHDLIDTLAERARSRDRTIMYTDHQSVESTRFAGTVLVVRDKTGSQIARGAG